MAILSDYTDGSITVAASGNTVTGTGTGWQVAEFREGDWFIADGWVNVIASVDSDTSLTLVAPWRGASLSDAPYRLRYMSDGSRSSAQARQLINMLGGSGNLEALGGLMGVPGTIPVFTGPGTMELRSYAAGLVPRGEWDVAETYVVGDLVIHAGNVFTSLENGNTGNEPPSTQTTDAHWMYVPVAPGPEGPMGPSAPLGIGTVVPGSSASASITGSVPNQKLNLVLPKGEPGVQGEQGVQGIQGIPGPANSLSIGTVLTGSTADATITGTAPSQTLSLILPKGDQGIQGIPGPANSLSIGTVDSGPTADASITGTAPSQTLNLILPKGEKGDQGTPGTAGAEGWTPVFAIVTDGARSVQQVVDWVGGAGTKPATGVYTGPSGFVTDIALAVNIRGAAGAGTGDMQSATYDPTNVAGDAFLRSNHHGTQSMGTIDGLSGALAGKFNNPTGSSNEYLDGTGAVRLFPSIPQGTVTSVAGKTGAVELAKGDVGLGNVDNTSDANKPVSTAQASAINAKVTKSNDTGLGGFAVSGKSLGNLSGSITPTHDGGNYQAGTITGALTINAPTAPGVYDLKLELLIGAGAGAVTLSGFSNTDFGEAFTTSAGDYFILQIEKGATRTIASVRKPE